MKKIFCIGLIIILLCGCNGDTVTPVTRQISFTANISYYNEQFTCETVMDEQSVMTMTVQSPEALKGLTFILDEDSTTAEFMGLTYTPDTENMAFAIVSRTIYDLLEAASDKKIEKGEKNGIVSGNVGERPFTLTVSAAGYLLDAKIPDESFTVEFMDMTIL